MAYKRITITLKGDPSDGEHIRLTDFLAQLEAIKNALVHVEEHLTRGQKSNIYYRVVDLSHNSPATVVLEAVPRSLSNDLSQIVVSKFVDGIREIAEGRLPAGFDYSTLASFKKLSAPLQRNVAEVSIQADSHRVEVTKTIEGAIHLAEDCSASGPS